MPLLDYYPAVKTLHVGAVVASGALFAVRGAAVQARAAWPMRKPWRMLSYLIDTVLLAGGATLWALLALNPLRDGWLGTKLLLLLLYIVLGSLALKRGRTATVRALAYAAALAVFGFIVGVARHHAPLGFFA